MPDIKQPNATPRNRKWIIEYSRNGQHYLQSKEYFSEDEAMSNAAEIYEQKSVVEVIVWRESDDKDGRFEKFYTVVKQKAVANPVGIAVTLGELRGVITKLIETYGTEFPVCTPMGIENARFDETTNLWCGGLLVAPKSVDPKTGKLLPTNETPNVIVIA